MKRMTEGDIANASPRPWRIAHVNRHGWAFVKAADDTIVAVCHADNARLFVEAVNEREVANG